MKNIILAFVLFLGTSVFAQSLYFPPLNGTDWDTLSTQSLGWRADSLSQLQSYLESKNTKAFIVLKSGRMAVEWYYDAFTRDSLWYWASAGKTLTAMLAGIAQERGFINIDDVSASYLGTGWTQCPPDKEQLITIRNQLTMTSGLDDSGLLTFCTAPQCLTYHADAGSRWAYHNAPYTLLGSVLETATGLSRNTITQNWLSGRIGMNGIWLPSGFNVIYNSNARSMARFGLLILNRGIWENDTLLHDAIYFSNMTEPSQDMNRSYGYLWWLNGQGSYMLPGLQIVFQTDLIPNAPDDLIAALGKNDQKIYVVPSLDLVVIRMGNAAGNPLFALSSFDNQLWGRLMNIVNTGTAIDPARDTGDENTLPNSTSLGQNYPNPFNPVTIIGYRLPAAGHVRLSVHDMLGRPVVTLVNDRKDVGSHEATWDGSDQHGTPMASGIYYYRLLAENTFITRKMILLR